MQEVEWMNPPKLGETLVSEDGQHWLVISRYPDADRGADACIGIAPVPAGKTAMDFGRTWTIKTLPMRHVSVKD